MSQAVFLELLVRLLDVDRRGWAPLLARLAHQALAKRLGAHVSAGLGEVATRFTERGLARALVADRGSDALEHVGPDWKLLHRSLVGVEDHHVELLTLHLARLDLPDEAVLDKSRKLPRVVP